MKSLFTRKTFQYFDLAKKNKFKKGWFEKNKKLYEEVIKEPFGLMILEIDHRIGRRLPGVIISPRKISRPVRPLAKAEEHGYVKAGAMFFLSEKTTSQFEWNPGLYLHLGDEKEDNVIGMGLYGPSSRQIKRLRKAFVDDYKEVDRILADRKFKKYWKGMADEKYVRFPKDYSVEDPAAKYLWYKQFYVRQQFTRKDVVSKDFAEHALRSFEAGIPLLTWIRDAIGIYDRREYEREKRERMEAEGDRAGL
jgi:uncharacterized protein (TIGR02453 family)